MKDFQASDGILHRAEGVDLMPSTIELSAMKMTLVNAMSREFTLRTYINEVKKNYDYVIIDCIFFDWDSPRGSSGPQDGQPDHTGIVEKIENGRNYIVEGNSGDSCRQNSYPIGYYEVLGYGVPAH